MKRLNIAIDGPAGAGKSTLAKAIAEKLGIRYLDTGAMYRAMALYAAEQGVDPRDRENVGRILANADIRVTYTGEGQRVLLSGEDVTGRLRTPEISMGASAVAVHPEVRQKLAELQRQVGRDYDVVMDGRDITTFVLPETKHKFFVTASAEERARRRCLELAQKGGDAAYADVLADIRRRDLQDSTRDYMPLRQTADAERIDTTGRDVDEIVESMLQSIREKEA